MKTFEEMLFEALIGAHEEEERPEPAVTKHEKFAREMCELVRALQDADFSRTEAMMILKAVIAASGKS